MSLISFTPPPGINSNDTAFAGEGQWIDGNNMRFVGGRAETIGIVFSTGAASLSFPVRNMFAFDVSGTTYLAYGTSRALWTGSGISTPTSRLSFGTDKTAWSLA